MYISDNYISKISNHNNNWDKNYKDSDSKKCK